jgi:hypothetical protein
MKYYYIYATIVTAVVLALLSLNTSKYLALVQDGHLEDGQIQFDLEQCGAASGS